MRGEASSGGRELAIVRRDCVRFRRASERVFEPGEAVERESREVDE